MFRMKSKSEFKSVFVGIDLGTRNALCSYVNELGTVESIRNRWGSLSTPSVVGWDGKWHVGEDAVRMALNGSEDVWWDVKHRINSPFRALSPLLRCGQPVELSWPTSRAMGRALQSFTQTTDRKSVV